MQRRRRWVGAVPAVLSVLLACGGGDGPVEGLYIDRSVIAASTCGPATIDPITATVQYDDDGDLLITLAAPTFDGRDAGPTTLRVRDDDGDVTTDDDALCGGFFAPDGTGEPMGAAVAGAAAPGTTSTTTTVMQPLTWQREETLERLPAADNTIRLRQTIRFRDVDACGDVRLPSVPARDGEVVRDITLHLREACPADRQRRVMLRLGTTIFCGAEDGG